MKGNFASGLVGILLAGTFACSQVMAAADKPNILVLWGDDVGQSNISTYTRGLVGYKTPNIDRIADDCHQAKNERCTSMRSMA